MKIGLVGVGNLGSAIAKRLIAGGFELVAYDIDEKARRTASDLGAQVAKSPKDLAQLCDLALLALPFPSDVDSVVAHEDGLLAGAKPGFTIVDMSTVGPGTTKKNASLAADKQVEYVDSPVLGRPASCGQWTVPVGGKREVVEKCRPVLGVLAKQVIHVGDLGSGNIVKLLNNMMFAVINATTAEMLALAAKLGMNPRVVYEIIANSGAATVSKLFLEVGSKILKGDFSPVFSIDLMWKDLDVALAMAREAGVPVIVTRNAQIINEQARSKGFGKMDTSAVVTVLEEMLGVEARHE